MRPHFQNRDLIIFETQRRKETGGGSRYCGWFVDSIHHFTNEKGSGAEMFSIHGPGIVTGVAPVNLIPLPSFC